MNVGEIKQLVMHQTNNDADDLGDFMPFLMTYLNDGYDRLVYAWARQHCHPEDAEYFFLQRDTDVPALPKWAHKALADWATWMIYRNGNIQKQNRGVPFLQAFQEILSRITSENGKKGRIRNFYNIPK